MFKEMKRMNKKQGAHPIRKPYERLPRISVRSIPDD